MCNYSGEKDDPQCHSPDDLPDDVVEATTQSLLKEGTMTSNAFGLLPFCKQNPAPAVSPNYYLLPCLYLAFTYNPSQLRFRQKTAFGRFIMTMRRPNWPGLLRKPIEKPPSLPPP